MASFSKPVADTTPRVLLFFPPSFSHLPFIRLHIQKEGDHQLDQGRMVLALLQEQIQNALCGGGEGGREGGREGGKQGRVGLVGVYLFQRPTSLQVSRSIPPSLPPARPPSLPPSLLPTFRRF